MMRRLCVVIAIAVCMAAAVRASKAHEWYPWECCSGIDCSEISESRVRVSPGGYMVDGEFLVPYAQAKSSPDGNYHACFPKAGGLKCFWAPKPSF